MNKPYKSATQRKSNSPDSYRDTEVGYIITIFTLQPVLLQFSIFVIESWQKFNQ